MLRDGLSKRAGSEVLGVGENGGRLLIPAVIFSPHQPPSTQSKGRTFFPKELRFLTSQKHASLRKKVRACPLGRRWFSLKKTTLAKETRQRISPQQSHFRQKTPKRKLL